MGMWIHPLLLPPPNPAELMQAMVENQGLLSETIRQMANQGDQDIQHGPTPSLDKKLVTR